MTEDDGNKAGTRLRFQLAGSPLWLRHFHFGPLEWLWRSLVYLKKQPFRRAAAPVV